MTFKVNKIPPSKPRPPAWKLGTAAKVLVVGLSILVVGSLAYGIQASLRDVGMTISLPSILNTVGGADLKTDADGKTNVLLLGTGGGYHAGGTLTDSMIIASYDRARGTVTMLSIPRDLYVRPGTRSGSGSMMRINQVYDVLTRAKGKEDALQDLRQLIARMTGLEIQYYVKVDFQAFVETVDILGGIDIDVPKGIVDDFYPVETSDGVFIRNERFVVQAGPQHMDGKTALKYVRSRYSTSDFDRSQRQQLVLLALKDKAQQQNYLTSAGKVRQLYGVISRNLETDIGLQEMIRGAYLASKLDRSRVVSIGLSTESGKPGAVLYTPDRSLTGGASVLLPMGSTVGSENYTAIQRFVDVAVNMPEIFTEKVPIVITNGTKRSGLAQRVKGYLSEAGFMVIETGNGKEKLARTRIVVSEEFLQTKTVEYLPIFLPGSEVVPRPIDPNGNIGSYVEIILGDDLPESRLSRR